MHIFGYNKLVIELNVTKKMQQPKINILRQENTQNHKPKISRIVLYPIVFGVIFFMVFSFQVLLSGNSITKFSNFIFNAGGLNTSSEKLLAGEENDCINILLLGMGGPGHPGPYLTDTMMLASIKPSTNEVALLSIPRDLNVPIGNEGWRKVNSLNHFGEQKEPGSGGAYASEVLSDIFAQEIHYYIRADFNGFVEVINELGGLTIYVDNAFTDTQFPDSNFGYQTISFKKGWQKMDGETALKYARSRHGTNGESSDFARSQRQQKVLKAAKDEALSASTFLNIRKISSLLDIYQEHVDTNLQSWEIFKLASMAKDFDSESLSLLVLDDSDPQGPIYSKIINGAYVLMPKDETFGELQNMIAGMFGEVSEHLEKRESATVEVQNGTFVAGLASRTAGNLRKNGYTVTEIGNASERGYEKTVIYDLTKGQKPNALEELRGLLNANVSTEPPQWLIHSAQANHTSNSDFIIILGEDQNI